MVDTSYYILNLDKDKYQNLKLKRKLRFSTYRSIKLYENLKEFDQILIAINKGQNKISIIAEYEITGKNKVPNRKTVYEITVEPIYHAPPNNGVKINNLLKMQLSENINFNNPIIEINAQEFYLLSNKLVN